MNKSTIDFVNRIKSIRKEKGLSQIELAKRCHVPQSTIGRIENHSMNPSLDMVMSILNILNVNIELTELERVWLIIKNSTKILKISESIFLWHPK